MTQQQMLMHTVAPGLVQLPAGSSVRTTQAGGGAPDGGTASGLSKKEKNKLKKVQKQLTKARKLARKGGGGGGGGGDDGGKGLGPMRGMRKGMRKPKKPKRPPGPSGGGGVAPPAKGKTDKGKGKGKGKNKKGEPLCFSWGRGRDGPCKDLGPNTECANTPKRKHECEFCEKSDHKSKDCPNKPEGTVW